MKTRKKNSGHPATDAPAATRSPARQAHTPNTSPPARLEAVSPDTAGTTEGAHGVRLNKAIAASGLCARRKADELIFAGRVAVDGLPETNPGRRILAGQTITVDGTPVRSKQEHAYLLLNKPVQTVCTLSDPQGRPTVMDCLPATARCLGLFPVGRLDYFSEGLLLLTNDGELANRLTHPRHHVDKVYEVLVRGPVDERHMETMRAGMRLADGTPLLPVAVSRIREGNRRDTLLRLVLRQGVNRQIRRMCDDLGLTVLRLRRVSQGMLRLGGLKPGEARFLEPKEWKALRASAGLAEPSVAPAPAAR